MNLSPAEQAWETPVPLLRASLPPFPLSALPFKLEQFARGLSTSTETPPDLAGSLVLACVSASVSRKAVVSPKADYREPLNLMLLVVLAPGERKSSVFGRVLAPLERREARLRDRARPEIARALEAREALKREIADLERRVRKSKERESVERLEAARATLAQMPIPSLPRLLADDTTPEAIPQLIADNDGRLCIASAEGGIFTTLRGRYSSGAVNIDTFLKGHAGDTLRVDRRNAEAIIVESPALSAALAVQPTVLTELVSQKEFRGRGLVARFLLSVPSPRVGTRTFDAPDLPESIGHEYDDTIQRLLDLPVTPQPLVLQLQPEGFRGWRAFALEVEHGCREDGELVGLRDWVAKLPGAVLRIAGLIHICERVSDLDRIQEPITSQTVERAVEIGRYYLAHARVALGAEVRDERRANAEALLAWASGRRAFSARQVQRSLRSRFPTADLAREAIAVLVEHGYIRPRQPPSPTIGRPPNQVFDVHPGLGADETRKPAEFVHPP